MLALWFYVDHGKKSRWFNPVQSCIWTATPGPQSCMMKRASIIYFVLLQRPTCRVTTFPHSLDWKAPEAIKQKVSVSRQVVPSLPAALTVIRATFAAHSKSTHISNYDLHYLLMLEMGRRPCPPLQPRLLSGLLTSAARLGRWAPVPGCLNDEGLPPVTPWTVSTEGAGSLAATRR